MICLLYHQKKNAFLIEVKDYRRPETARPSELPLVLASKVHDTLAALLPARLHANELTERNLAASILKCRALQVVFHIEQRPNQQVVDLADLQQKTRRLLRAIDTKPKFVSMKAMQNLGWTVSQPSQGHSEF